MERVITGIKGFDELVDGGLPKNSAILLSGSPGTGKTIFGLEYIYRGANDHGEKGMYVSFEQNPDDLREQARQLGFSDLERLEMEGNIVFVCLPVHAIDKDTIPDFFEQAQSLGVKRIVVDSLSALSVNAPIFMALQDPNLRKTLEYVQGWTPQGEDLVKNFIYKFIAQLKSIDATSVLVSEIPEKSDKLSSDGISDFAADGIILMSFESMGGEFSRSMLIRKMRMTKNDEDIHPVEISKEGLKIHSVE